MSSIAGHKFLAELKDFADSDPNWEGEDYWNEADQDRGKINMHHLSGWDFYVSRNFDTTSDEMVYVQPLLADYSTYGLEGTSYTTLIDGQPVACSFLSRPELEAGEVMAIGDAVIYMVEGASSISWCAQVGVSNALGFGISSLGSFGFIDDYRFAGGLPYDLTNERPLRLKDHFFTEDGSIQAWGADGNTYVFTAHSFADMLEANPYVEDSILTFRLFRIYIRDLEDIVGFLPDLFWLSSYQVTLEPSDGITLYIPEEASGRVFQDGNRVDRWVALQSPVQI